MRGALVCAQAVNSYLEFLTLRAIYEVYIGNTSFQADIVKDDFDNINKPANASDLAQRLSEVPSAGHRSPGKASQTLCSTSCTKCPMNWCPCGRPCHCTPCSNSRVLVAVAESLCAHRCQDALLLSVNSCFRLCFL